MTAPETSRLDDLAALISECEAAKPGDQETLLWKAALAVRGAGDRLRELLDVGAYMDAAISLLPKPAVWRKFVDQGCSVYAASPFNAAAQVRYDGHGDVDSLTLTAALLRLVYAREAKALARTSPAAAASTASDPSAHAVARTGQGSSQ